MVSATRTLALATLALISTAATSSTNPLKKDDSTEVAGLNWSFYNIAALSGAVLVVSAGFAALVAIFLPLFAFTSCYYIFGTCRDTFNILEDFVIPRKVNKRSVEYLEPVLTTLANAYEKYADNDVKKKSKKPTF
ncbi:hypothetical protein MTP99_019024 [Tenebrio molitor]|jgi:hypothetical protein|nr:hypothetical protein MTP99_019024 [Tenebrio molitor]CAH1377634.1 unnamed protein product [Tenebrio molitor]